MRASDWGPLPLCCTVRESALIAPCNKSNENPCGNPPLRPGPDIDVSYWEERQHERSAVECCSFLQERASVAPLDSNGATDWVLIHNNAEGFSTIPDAEDRYARCWTRFGMKGARGPPRDGRPFRLGRGGRCHRSFGDGIIRLLADLQHRACSSPLGETSPSFLSLAHTVDVPFSSPIAAFSTCRPPRTPPRSITRP